MGGLRNAKSLHTANPNQIATVITLCQQPVFRRAASIRYLHYPIRDARPVRIAWLNAILTSIEEGMARGSVLVHCGAGLSRAPMVVAAFLDRMGLFSFDAALRYIEQLRPAIAPSAVLAESISRELGNL